MGSGFPVSGVLLSDELGKAEPFGKPSASSSSYGGNPLAAVAVSETIGAIQREHLVENSRKVGAMMLSRLVALKEKYEFIGDVRGKWVYINGEAHVTWDDGAQDAIRKVGSKFRKYAYAAGKSFTDKPDNEGEAHNTSPHPI